MPKRLVRWDHRLQRQNLFMAHLNVVVVVVISHILVANPEKTTLHNGQFRSWFAEQRKNKKIKVWQRPPPPPPLHAVRSEKIK